MCEVRQCCGVETYRRYGAGLPIFLLSLAGGSTFAAARLGLLIEAILVFALVDVAIALWAWRLLARTLSVRRRTAEPERLRRAIALGAARPRALPEALPRYELVEAVWAHPGEVEA